MLFKTLFIISSIGLSHAFFPRYTSQIKGIISSKGIITGFMTAITEEVLNDNYFMRELIFNHKGTNMDIVYFGLLIATIINKKNVDSIYSRWNHFEMFSNMEKNTRLLFLVIMIIFNRNIENAI
jgi:hypothetical protein